MNSRRNHLWLALRLRNLPLFALADTASPDTPVAVVERGKGKGAGLGKVAFCNRPAEELGAARGMDAATVQLLGDCHLLTRDSDREYDVLCQWRDRLYSITPHIDIHISKQAPQSGLQLEISSCLRLFGGLQNLCNRALEPLTDAGLEVRPGVAHTAGAAWLLSFANHEITGSDHREAFIARLNQLPVQVLYDHPEAVDALLKMGFSTLGDVARQIQSSAVASFTRRLGKGFAGEIMELYDIGRDFSQAGLFAQSRNTHTPQVHFLERIQFDYPVPLVEHLKPAFEHLLQSLGDFLRQHQWQCQRIQWRLSDSYRNLESVDVYSDLPQTGWELLYDLTLIHFDNRDMPFEVDCLELFCDDRISCGDSRGILDLHGRNSRGNPAELVATMSKLKTRLGDDAVHKVSYRDSLVPELSHAIIGLAEKARQQLPDIHSNGLRPSWLFPTPHPVELRGERLFWQGYLTLAVGPERLSGHWWEEPVARDYYLARRHDNVAVWLYRDLHTREWYVHGVFS